MTKKKKKSHIIPVLQGFWWHYPGYIYPAHHNNLHFPSPISSTSTRSRLRKAQDSAKGYYSLTDFRWQWILDRKYAFYGTVSIGSTINIGTTVLTEKLPLTSIGSHLKSHFMVIGTMSCSLSWFQQHLSHLILNCTRICLKRQDIFLTNHQGSQIQLERPRGHIISC